MVHGETCRTTSWQEEVKLWRPTDVAGLELMRASFVNHFFPKHMHETLAVAITDAGCGAYSYRGARHTTFKDDILLFNAGEVHTGHPIGDEGWAYRMFYIDVALLKRAAAELDWPEGRLPFFPDAVVKNARLAHLLRNLHSIFEQPASRLERESWLLWALGALITGYADEKREPLTLGSEMPSLHRVRDFLDAHYAKDVSIDTLAQIAQLSSAHLIRSFRQQYGIPPIAYQNAVRIIHAKHALHSGVPILQVALDTGFYDQSHLNRVFKRVMGMTPGQYRAAVTSSKLGFE